MTIFILGTDEQAGQLREKFGNNHVYTTGQPEGLMDSDVVFDFRSPMEQDFLARYPAGFRNLVFIDSSIIPLGQTLLGVPALRDRVAGFCGLKGFINRELLEVTALTPACEVLLEKTCSALHTKYHLVADQAGMISPRM